MSNNINARELALKVLYKIEKEKAYSNIALDEELSKYKLDNKDIGLASELVYGVVTWKLTLDEIIKKYSKIKLKKISVWILNILRIGIYQIIFLDKIPDFGAVNECVKLAKRYGHNASSGFVNAILRKLSIKDLEELNYVKDEKENIAVTTSHPVWLVEKLLKEFDSSFVKDMCKSNNKKANLTARVNTLKISKDELVKILKNKDIECENGILENTITFKNLKNIAGLKEFNEGLFMIQDEAATLVSTILSPKPLDLVLDACAAPRWKNNQFGRTYAK